MLEHSCSCYVLAGQGRWPVRNPGRQMELARYGLVLGVANLLVDAIQRTVKPRLPVGGSQTGGGMAYRRR